MKIFPFFILLISLLNHLKAGEAHLTKEQVKQITALVAKNQMPGEPMYDSKTGIWTCSAGPSGPSFGIVVEIRDKDGYYRHLGESKDFKLSTSLKRRITKIVESRNANK